MQLVLIVYNESIDDEVAAALGVVGSSCCFTKWRRVVGRGRRSGPHLDSPVWPKANNALAVALDEDRCRVLMDELKRLRREKGEQGIKAFLLPLLEVT